MGSSDGHNGFDQAVLNALPEDSSIISVADAGKSDWTKTSCISVILPDQSKRKYFLKSAPGLTGKTMLLGEYTASTAVHTAMPSLIAKPHTWGKFSTSDDYFILFDYRNTDQTLPDPDKFTSRLAELHRTAISENGMFGFSVTTCDGAVPHTVAWQKSWALFFANLLRGILRIDTEANGHWAELDEVFDRTISLVIPLLLGVLQSDGRELRPSLIHGDMGEGNVGTDLDTGEIIFVDASSYYAHNEMELGLWRWIETMGRFTESYLRHFPPDEPVEEWDDRNRLYSLKTKLNMSADHPGEEGRRIRRVAYEDMCYLCDKYASAAPTLARQLGQAEA